MIFEHTSTIQNVSIVEIVKTNVHERLLNNKVSFYLFCYFFNFLKEKMIFVVYINNGGRNYGNKNQA